AREKEALPDRSDESSKVGSLERAQKARHGPTLRSRSQAQSLGLLATLVSIAVPVGGARRAPDASAGSAGDRALDDNVASSTHRRRLQALEEINSVSSNSPSSGLPLPFKKEVGGHLLTIQQLWGELEAVRVTEKQREIEVEGLKGKLAATEAEKVAIQNDLDLMKEKHRRQIEGREATGLKERSMARRSLAREYDAVLAVVREKLRKKKEETAAEIRLQEVRARIEALTEYSEGGFELEEELGHLRDKEISLNFDYGVASLSDLCLSRLELPEVFGDSVDHE
ncbi:hypothetical protein HID58_051876, partial [Brassica napus]